MTRKRFVKLLMALGYSRNEANIMAAVARIRCMQYDLKFALIAFERLQDTAAAATNAFASLVACLQDFFADVGNGLRAEKP